MCTDNSEQNPNLLGTSHATLRGGRHAPWRTPRPGGHTLSRLGCHALFRMPRPRCHALSRMPRPSEAWLPWRRKPGVLRSSTSKVPFSWEFKHCPRPPGLWEFLMRRVRAPAPPPRAGRRPRRPQAPPDPHPPPGCRPRNNCSAKVQNRSARHQRCGWGVAAGHRTRGPGKERRRQAPAPAPGWRVCGQTCGCSSSKGSSMASAISRSGSASRGFASMLTSRSFARSAGVTS